MMKELCLVELIDVQNVLFKKCYMQILFYRTNALDSCHGAHSREEQGDEE